MVDMFQHQKKNALAKSMDILLVTAVVSKVLHLQLDIPRERNQAPPPAEDRTGFQSLRHKLSFVSLPQNRLQYSQVQ